MKSKKLSIIASIAALAYAGLVLFPQPLFPHKITEGKYTVYSRQPAMDKVVNILKKTDDLLKCSEFYTPDTEHRIFLADSFKTYAMMAPTSANAYAATYVYMGNVFIAKSDIDADLSFRKGGVSTRTLSGTIAHEITHTLIKNGVGILKYVMLPSWKEEGYCDYIAQESSFDTAKGMALLRSGGKDDSQSFKYFRYRLLVKYLVEVKKMSFREIADADIDPDKLEKEAASSISSL